MGNLLIAIVLTASILIVLVKTGHFRKFLGYQAPLDIVVTLLIGIVFLQGAGGLNAMIIAILGGFVFSVVLWFIGRVCESEKLTRVFTPDGRKRWRWMLHPPKGFRFSRN